MVPLAIPLRVSQTGSPSEPAALSEPQPAFNGPLTPADGPTWAIRLRKQDQEERDERKSLLDLHLHALGSASAPVGLSRALRG